MKIKSVTVLLAFCASGISAHASQPVSGYIVKLRSQPSLHAFNVMTAAPGAERLTQEELLFYVPDSSAAAALAMEAEYVEPNQPVYIKGQPAQIRDAAGPVPPAKVYPNDWGQKAINADAAHALGFKGDGIIVAVVDTGVDANHPELQGRVLADQGFNFVNNTKDATDDQGHGTHVSGVIAGKTLGVAPGAKILPVKFLDSQGGGSTQGAIKAVDFVRQKKAHVMSNSWGGPIKSQALADASFKAAIAAGVIVTAAAGNDGDNNDVVDSFPSSYPDVVAVAAIDNDSTAADFTNYGQKVLIGAPGVKIYSSIIGNTYEQWDGTSMATPFVSAIAALYQGKVKHTPAQFRACLKKTADVPTVPLKIETRGIINAKRIVTECI